MLTHFSNKWVPNELINIENISVISPNQISGKKEQIGF